MPGTGTAELAHKKNKLITLAALYIFLDRTFLNNLTKLKVLKLITSVYNIVDTDKIGEIYN